MYTTCHMYTFQHPLQDELGCQITNITLLCHAYTSGKGTKTIKETGSMGGKCMALDPQRGGKLDSQFGLKSVTWTLVFQQ